MVGDQESGEEPEVDAEEASAPEDELDEASADGLEPAEDDDPLEDAEPLDGDDPLEDAESLEDADDQHEADAPAALAEAEETDAGDADGTVEPIVVEPWQPPVRRHRWVARIVGLAALAIPTIVVGSVALRATGLQPEAKVDDRLIGALRYDGEGDPLVRTPKAGVGSVVRREWRVCGKSCDAISGRGKEFRPGEVLAGSRVQVRVVGSSGEATIETPGWDGQLRALRRPTITGSARIGSVVEANPGKWTGGWLGAETFTGLRACPTRQGGGKCVALTASALGLSDTRKRTLPASFRGWWIGAIEWHVPPGRNVTTRADQDPASPTSAERAPTPGATVKVGPLEGPVR